MSPVGANIRGSRSSKDRCCSGISWVGVAGEEISSLRENWSFPSFSTSSQLQTLNGRLWVWSIKSTYSESDPWTGCGFCSCWKSWCLKGIFQKYRPPARPYLIDMVYTCFTDFLRQHWNLISETTNAITVRRVRTSWGWAGPSSAWAEVKA